MNVEEINVTGRWAVLLAMVILLGLLAAFVIFANVREESSHGLHEIIGGLIALTGTYSGGMFWGKNGGTTAPTSHTTPPPVSPIAAPTK